MYSCDDRYCPLAGHEIGSEVCYEVVMCLTSGFNPSSVPEVDFENNEQTRRICDKCQYSNLD